MYSSKFWGEFTLRESSLKIAKAWPPKLDSKNARQKSFSLSEVKDYLLIVNIKLMTDDSIAQIEFNMWETYFDCDGCDAAFSEDSKR